MIAPVRWGSGALLCVGRAGVSVTGYVLDQGSGARLASFGNDRSPSLVDYQKPTANVRIISLATPKMTPSRHSKIAICIPLKTIVLLLFISSVRVSLSMNWGDIVDESERIESAVSKQGETLYVAGTTARLSSDIDRYRVPSQDWGYPAFFRKPIQQTISCQSRNGGNGDTQQLSETRKKKGRCKGNESKQC